MATLEKIRSKAGILVAAIIVLDLLAFVLGDFLTGKSSFLFTGSKNDVGEISGKSVSIQLLDQKVKDLEAIEKLKTGKSTPDDSKSEEIKQNAWQQIIYENVMEKEFDKLGLTVSPDELFDLIQGPNPHSMVRQLFTNPQTGEFNRSMLLQFLKGTNDNPTSEQMAFRLYLEKEIKTDRINNKYINLIRKGLSVPTFLAKNEYIASNKKVDFKYIIQRFNSGSDSSLSITSSDIKKYYNDHKYLYYNQTATRDIEYVSFDVVPSKEDTAGFKEWIYKIKPDFVNTTDAEPFVNGNSDEQYNDKNYIESDLPDSLGILLFKESVGAVHGPYFDNGAFKLARLYKIVYVPDSVKARHILITPKGNTKEDLEKAKATADSVKKMLENGADFAALAKQYSADKSNSEKGGDLGWFQEGRMVKSFSDTAFAAKKGQIKEVETNYGVHLLQVMDKGKEKKKVKVAFIIKKVIPSQLTYNQFLTVTMKFASENRTYEQFKKAITKQRLVKQLATNVGENDKTIPGLTGEKPRDLINWIYNSKKNDISEPITIGDHNIVAALTEVREKGPAPLQQVKNEVNSAVRKEKKAEKLIEKINKAKSGVASIEDLALKLGSPVDIANGITFSSYSVRDAGIEPKLIAYATNCLKSKLSQPIDGNNGVYVIDVANILEAPPTKDYTMSKQQLMNTLQGEASYESYNALIKLANIVDNRRKFGY